MPKKSKDGGRAGGSRTLSVPKDLYEMTLKVCENASETPELRPEWQDVAVRALRRGLAPLARKTGVEPSSA